MARGVGALNVSVNADTAKATRNIGTFRSELGSVRGSIAPAAAGMSALSAAAVGLGVAAAGLAGVWSVVSPSMEEIDGLAKASDRIGIATEKLAGLRLAAEESGVSVGQFDKGLVKMLRSVAEVNGGTGEAKDAFDALGLSARNLISMAPDEQFRLIAERLNEIPSSAEKLDVAMSIFGRAGADLVNVLALGKDGLDEAQQAAEKLGLTMSRDAAKSVEAANDAMGRIGKSVTGLGNSLAIALAPAIEKSSNALSTLVSGFADGIFNDIPYFLGMVEEVNLATQEQELAAQRAAAAAKVQAEAEHDLTKAYEKEVAALKEKLAFTRDPGQAQRDKDAAQFGEARAMQLLHLRGLVEGELYMQEKEKARLQEEERQKAEEERKKEQLARDKEKKHQENLKRDAELLRTLRERVENFGKSEMEIEKDRTLRELDDPKQKQEAREHFATLERLQKGRDELDKLRGDRDRLADRRDPSMLDARTAEGWAALRSTVNPQLQKLDRQIALLEEANRLAKEKPKEEVFPF